MDDARQFRYELTLDDREPTEFVVLDFEVREALSRGCRVTVRAASASFFDGSALLGKDGHLCVFAGEDDPRWWNGAIVRCALRKTPNGGNLLEVELVSRVSLLGIGSDNRIFLDAGEMQVVQKVLELGQIPAAKQEWNLAKEPPVKPQIFQRQESDLGFIQRLLSRTGIGYAVHNGEDGEKLVFFDDSTSLPPITGDPALLDRDAANLGHDFVYAVRERAAVRSDGVMLRDYDPLLPGANLDAKAPAAGGTREIYLHPDGYDDIAVGKRLAQRALDSASVGKQSITGRSDCPRLEPGRRFSIGGHKRDVLNHEYLLLEVVHRGHLSDTADGQRVAYDNDFVAIRKEVPFRPPLVQPTHAGCEMAFVTCPPGEEIHVDEFGRCKVRFLWDRSGVTDDKSSEWLRVGQLPLGGSMILPRGGFEVLIDFELGNIDRPYVAGHLYNGQSPPPYALPGGATVSSVQTNTTSRGPGANEIRFEDAAGSEEIFLNASKDLTISVDNDADFDVLKNETAKVGSNSELNVGTNHVAVVLANRKLQVGSTQSINVGGDYSEGVGTNADVQIGGARKVQCGGDHAETTNGTLTRTVGALQAVTGLAGFARNVVGNAQVTVGAAWMEVVARSRGSDVGGSRTETVGALKLTRAKDVNISVGASLTVNAAAEVVKCRGNRTDSAEGALSIAAGGGLSIKAQTIVIEAQDNLVMNLGACTIKLSKGGQILIKAPTIDLKGTKALGQVMHGSN